MRKFLAYGVHLFTASGILAAFMAILAIQSHDFKAAMLWLFVAFAIDGLDGLAARAVRVSEVLPDWDGKNIDFVIDFATYAIIPAYFMHEAVFPDGSLIFPAEYKLYVCFAVLLTSAMYYGKSGMVSNDNYFVGFPVLWNFVVFYQFFVLHLSEWANLWITLFLCALHFVPIKVPYPSQSKGNKWLDMTVVCAAVAICGMALYNYPSHNPIWAIASLVPLAYWVAQTVYVTYFSRAGS